MRKILIILLTILISTSFLAGCVNEKSSQKETQKIITIRTTGATFPKYQIEKWIADFQKEYPNIKVEYEGGGSGHGQDAFLKGLTHIGRSDPPVTEKMWKKFLSTGDQPLQFPEIVGAVVVTYNVPEIGKATLNLTPEVIAKIFKGDIKYWDDPAIKELNPGLNLPHKEIVTIHRSDASGTTKIFTTYLNLATNGLWPSDYVGKNWPSNLGGIGGKGNPGVIAILEKTPYSIAYTELSYTIKNNLPVAAIKNKAGNFVTPTDETIKAAVAAVKANIPDPTEGYKEDLKQLLNAPGKNAYPIVAFTHFLVWENKNKKHYSTEEAKAVKTFVKWVLTEGQKPEHLAEGYVGLPPEVAQIGLKAIDMVKE
ncbi:phosphate ABC transporter, periplasmic phosphate-binding protein [Methanocaldococcus villosus KIN24-T80]|uniref:Phosphate-binding protein n=1 Tax=Methanocaldococcus villosus KIN24-T80 TaxID=1069083 RepID=N6V1T2_9EURY|nr:phosphate ABC transporter substrate-binding protein PstS [Methanocaldococcus villosus]ENN96248.1 phosphate ABC transporter, periplasmic phosphate-binding protein [Methanocaldococcus villosus KIN24-T80]